MKIKKYLMILATFLLALFTFTKVNAADPDYSGYHYTQVTQSSATVDVSKYYYYFVVQNGGGIVEGQITPSGFTHVIPKDKTGSTDENCIYFSLSNPNVTKVTINGEEVDFYKNGGALAYVPLDLFENEYNNTTIYSNSDVLINIIINNRHVTEEKENAIKELDKYLTEGSSEAVKALVAKAKEAIENAENKAAVDKVLEELEAQIEVQEAKEKALADLNELIGENPSDEVSNLSEEAKKEINDATTKDNVQTAFTNAKNKIELQQAKEEALSDLDELIGENPSDEVNKLYEEAIQKVNESDSKEDVKSILKTALDAIELQQAKEQAITSLTELLGKKYSNSLKNIYDKALSKINEATSKEDVEKILKEAEKDMENQIKKEEQEAKAVKNPITLDSIITSFLTLGTSSALIATSVKKSRLLKR